MSLNRKEIIAHITFLLFFFPIRQTYPILGACSGGMNLKVTVELNGSRRPLQGSSSPVRTLAIWLSPIKLLNITFQFPKKETSKRSLKEMNDSEREEIRDYIYMMLRP